MTWKKQSKQKPLCTSSWVTINILEPNSVSYMSIHKIFVLWKSSNKCIADRGITFFFYLTQEFLVLTGP